MTAARGGPLPGAGQPIGEAGLEELERLVERTGWPAAQRMIKAVCGIERRDHLDRVTLRDLATLRIGLEVLAQSAGDSGGAGVSGEL